LNVNAGRKDDVVYGAESFRSSFRAKSGLGRPVKDTMGLVDIVHDDSGAI